MIFPNVVACCRLYSILIHVLVGSHFMYLLISHFINFVEKVSSIKGTKSLYRK